MDGSGNSPTRKDASVPKTAIVLCAVLELEIDHFAAGADHIDRTVMLEQGLHNEPNKLRQQVQAAIDEIERDTEAEVIVLGCTGMYFLAEEIRKTLAVPVIEPASLTLKIAESLARLNLRHGKTGMYMLADPKKLVMD